MKNRLITLQQGFTLVELMIVVVIIGLLLAIAVPVYNKITNDAMESTHHANERILLGAVHQYIADNGVPAGEGAPPDGWESVLMEYIHEWPNTPRSYSGRYFIEGSFPDYRVVILE